VADFAALAAAFCVAGLAAAPAAGLAAVPAAGAATSAPAAQFFGLTRGRE
jgi:hypothetical protein